MVISFPLIGVIRLCISGSVVCFMSSPKCSKSFRKVGSFLNKILRRTISHYATIRGHAPPVIRVRNVHRERVDNLSLLGRALLDQRCTAFAPSSTKSGHVETCWSFISRNDGFPSKLCWTATRHPGNYLCRVRRIDKNKNGNVVAYIAKTGCAWSKVGRLDKRQRPTEGGSVDVCLSLVKLLVHRIFLYQEGALPSVCGIDLGSLCDDTVPDRTPIVSSPRWSERLGSCRVYDHHFWLS